MASSGTKSSGERPVLYARLGGLCETKPEPDGVLRFERLENMYVDYEAGDGALESIPGFRRVYSFGERVNGIFTHRDEDGADVFIVHVGERLYRFRAEDVDGLDAFTLSPIEVMKNARSTSFSFCGDLYVMDGSSIVRINELGETVKLTESNVYIPTVYKNGERHESRSVITDRAIELYTSVPAQKMLYGSPELQFAVTDESRGLCAVVGYDGAPNKIFIPAYATIGDRSYRVVRIDDGAFARCTTLKSLVTYPSLEEIGASAFAECTALTSVLLSSTLKLIEKNAFYGCSSLTDVHFNRFPIEVESGAFVGVNSEAQVGYAVVISNVATLFKGTGLESLTHVVAQRDTSAKLSIPIHAPYDIVQSVTLGGRTASFTLEKRGGVGYIVLSLDRLSEAYEKRVEITMILANGAATGETARIPFLNTGGVLGIDAIRTCRVAEVFDGRVFLSGSPKAPGVVFYTDTTANGFTTPLYFTPESTIFDGSDSSEVVSMLGEGDTLTVFRSSNNGSGAVYCHKRHSEGGRISYPVRFCHRIRTAIGAAVSYSGDSLFLTEEGISALEKNSDDSHGAIVSRSLGIRLRLTREELAAASVSRWRGYLAIGVGGRILLADSRGAYKINGKKQYEWYPLTNIGVYDGDRRVYRYSSLKKSTYAPASEPDAAVKETVYSTVGTDGEEILYVNIDGERTLVYSTEERDGGVFDPADLLFCYKDRLFFTTESGVLCSFNSDKRGAMPPTATSDPDISKEEYEGDMGGRIHPYFYSFDGHRVSYVMHTCADDLEYPHCEKIILRGSASVKFKQLSSVKVTLESNGYDRGLQSLGEAVLGRSDFCEVDFSRMTFSSSDSVIIALPESDTGIYERQLRIYSDGFCSPFGVYSTAFRYKIKGDAKNE